MSALISNIFTQVFITLIAVAGVYVLTGLTGMFSLGQAAFMAIGAYASGLLEEMLEREPYQAPEFILDPSVTDFYQFTPDSVRLEGYQAHPVGGKIPVAV